MATIPSYTTECDKHTKQLNLYCPSHLKPCCDECISTSHYKCTGIKSLASAVEKSNIEKTKESVEKDISSILHLLDKIEDNKLRNIKTGEQQCEDIKISMSNIRKAINKRLKILEKKLFKEANTILDQEKSKATDLITEIKRKKKKLKKNQDNLNMVTTKTSKLQSFLCVHQIEQQVHRCQRYVENLEKDERAKQVDINMKQRHKIKKRLSRLGALESLGEVTLVKTAIDVNSGKSVRREAQVELQKHINNMTINIETKIEINMKIGISDLICLMDGRVIIGECFGKLSLLTSDGKLLKHLPIPGEPWSVTQINQDTIAITYPNDQTIKIFNMENETVTKVITLDKYCYGLSFCNNSLAVGLIDDDGDDGDEIRIIDLEGNTLKSIQVQSISLLEYLVYCNDRVIYSDYYGKAVYCVDALGEQIWQYKDDLSSPKGLCTDNYGNIIIADYESKRIIVISKDGQNSKILISKEDGLNRPQCICLKHSESSGFICDFNGTYLAKFNLS